MLYLLISCGGDNKDYITLPFDRETVPTLQDDSVTMLISDSGIIRYKVITKDWQAFDRASDPHWYFPQGIYVEQFDTMFIKQASIKADTAWNYTNKRLWHLKGNVFMKNIREETFKTDELFWNEKEQKIYSDKYIEIYRPDKLTLQGIGFESNMDMTRYKIFKPFDSDFIVSDQSEQATATSADTDTIQ
ncbi:MAG: LPS export ABC transporter periplasmic protein LptC [Dysgonomonas sp.]|nr:LPS export ABC transporter periplasmic protein LptC [Dysgonomonas sp.]